MQRRPTAVWPYMLVFAFTFSLCITAPRSWELVAQRHALAPAGAARSAAVATSRAGQTVIPTASIGQPSRPEPRTAAQHRVAASPKSTTLTTIQASAKPFVNASPKVETLIKAKTPVADAPDSLQTTPPTSTVVFDSVKDPFVENHVVTPVLEPKLVAPVAEPTKTVAEPSQTAVEPTKTAVAEPAPIEAAETIVIVERPITLGPVTVGHIRLSGIATIGTEKIAVPVKPLPVKPVQASQPVAGPALPTPTTQTPVVEAAPITKSAPVVEATPDVKAAPAPDVKAAPVVQSAPVVAPPVVESPPVAVAPIVEPLPVEKTPEPRVAALAKKPSPAPVATIEVPQIEPPVPVKIAPPAPEIVVEPPGWWPAPTDLIARLEALNKHPAARTWAEHIRTILQQLTKITDPTSPQVAKLLAELRTVVADPVALYDNHADDVTELEVRLTRHALLRRLDVWESLTEVLRRSAAGAEFVSRDAPRQLELCLVELDRELSAAGDAGRSWREYLLLDLLKQSVHDAGRGNYRGVLACEVLQRIRTATQTVDNSLFLTRGSFARFDDCLRDLSEAEVDGRRLLENIELFEQSGLPSGAHALASECLLLNESSQESRRKLAEWLNSYYRNANVRIAFAPDLLNRALPDSLKRNAPVNQTILGQATKGWSTTRTGLNLRFLPNDDRLALRFEAQGLVQSQTRTYSGPVRLFSHSNANFSAHKDLALSATGLSSTPSTASSKNNTRLRGVESDYDGLPFIGSIVASIARDKHAESKTAAQRESSWKIARQVERQLDTDIDRYLDEAEQKFAARVGEPLSKLQIKPEVVDLRSAEDRAVMRLRIAGSNQLAANTPRPRAYADCLGSLQLHQSAANNLLERMAFGGKEFTLPELVRYVADTWSLTPAKDPTELPSELVLKFKDVDPVTVTFDEGRFELRMALDELRYADKSWKDFVVRASFRPTLVDGAHHLVRDGLVRLSGPKLGTGAQISLRTVFAKVFPEDMQVPLRPKLLDDPRFADLAIEQFEIRDGWLGVAVGPKRETAQSVWVDGKPGTTRR